MLSVGSAAINSRELIVNQNGNPTSKQPKSKFVCSHLSQPFPGGWSLALTMIIRRSCLAPIPMINSGFDHSYPWKSHVSAGTDQESAGLSSLNDSLTTKPYCDSLTPTRFIYRFIVNPNRSADSSTTKPCGPSTASLCLSLTRVAASSQVVHGSTWTVGELVI